MKKFLTVLLSGTMIFSLAACSEKQEVEPSQTQQVQEDLQGAEPSQTAQIQENLQELEAEKSPSSEPIEEENDTNTNLLVAYFSYGENAALPDHVDVSSSASIQVWNDDITGNTGVVASMIADAIGADLFSIQTVEQYPDSYDATIDKGQQEKSASTRPALVALPATIEDYDVIFLGFPNWWGDMPMALYSFLDEVDLSGKTIIPFVTSGGSGFSSTISTIGNMEPDATVQEGISLRDSSAVQAQEEIEKWLSGLGYME